MRGGKKKLQEHTGDFIESKSPFACYDIFDPKAFGTDAAQGDFPSIML